MRVLTGIISLTVSIVTSGVVIVAISAVSTVAVALVAVSLVIVVAVALVPALALTYSNNESLLDLHEREVKVSWPASSLQAPV